MKAKEEGMQEELVSLESFYKEMLDISDSQKKILLDFEPNTDQIDKLNDLLTQRQLLIEKIDRLGIQWKEDSSRFNHIRTIILSIQENDNINRQLLSKAMNKQGKSLGQIRANKKAYHAYKQINSSDQAWFFDKKK